MRAHALAPAILAATLLAFPAAAAPVVSPWVPLYNGISFANGRDPTGPQSIQTLRIDLLAPGLRFATTASSAAQYPGFETFSQTTGAYLAQTGAQVAINANFFSTVSTTAQPQNLSGLAVSGGQVVSPAEAGFSSLLITAANQARISSAPNGADIAAAFTAVSGGALVLQAGVPVNVPAGQPGDPTNPNPRTAVGLSQDGRYLYMMTIDGRRTGVAAGTTQQETGQWLSRFGAYTGLNLDGGGSTTMVRADNRGGQLELNRPSGNAQRLNGNNLAVFASPLHPADGGTYEATARATLPTAYYRFGEAAGSTSVANAISSSHTASISGTTVQLGQASTPITADAAPGSSARFGGPSSARLNVPYSASLNTPSFTVAAWAMVDGTVPASTFQGLVSSRDDKGGGAAGNGGFVLYAGPADGVTDARWQFWTGGTTAQTYNFMGRNRSGYGLGPSVKLNQWQLIVGVFEALSGPDATGRYTGTQSLYVDGVLALQMLNIKFLPNALQSMTIGAGGNETAAGSFAFGGLIDEVGLYNYALTGADVANLYAAAVPAPAPGGLALVGLGVLGRRRRALAA